MSATESFVSRWHTWFGSTTNVRVRQLAVFAAFLLLTSGNAYAQDSVESDRAALLAFYNATGGANWTNNTNWLTNEAISKWHGVVTDGEGRVKRLLLGHNELSGTLPAELGDLANLQELYLDNNELSGEIPAELGGLTNLWQLSLSQNRLSGPLPLTLSALPQLMMLDIRSTNLCAPTDTAFRAWVKTIYFQGNYCDDTTQAPGGGVFTLDFAHSGNGDSVISDLVLVNVADQPVRPSIYFYDKAGDPIAAETVVDVTEDLEITEDGSLSVRTAMEPLGELTISTPGRGALVSGSVKVVSEGPIGGVLRFDLPGIGVAGVGVSHYTEDALFPARRQAGGISTAVAIHNLESSPKLVRCELLREGVLLDAVPISLAANGQQARFIDEMFPATDTSDFVGSVRCTVPDGGLFTGVAVELDAANRIFTTLPVGPVPERISQE